jgi:P4 family phage/plasmid primase-like protien
MYYKKSDALDIAKNTGKILANKSITQYFIINDYSEFLDIIKNETRKNYFEYISPDVPLPFFFDIEIYKDKSIYYDDYFYIISLCIDSVIDLCKNNTKIDNPTFKKIILQSHSENKLSFHIIVRVYDSSNSEILFSNVNTLKKIYKSFDFDKFKDDDNKNIIDPSVYKSKGGLFRTIYSSKPDEIRPLIKSELSDDFDDLESFVCYNNGQYTIFEEKENVNTLPNSNITFRIQSGNGNANDNANQLSEVPNTDSTVINIPEDLDNNNRETIKKFIQREFHYIPSKIREIFIDKEHNCIIVALTEKYCPFLDREHKSNFQYIVIDTSSAKQKCHDTDCLNQKYNEIKLENYPKEMHEIIKKCLKINQQELDLINIAIIECKNYITENFDNQVSEIQFDKTQMVFKGNAMNSLVSLQGKCKTCRLEHHITNTGYCLKCSICESIFPKTQLIPVDPKYKTLNSFWMNYTQLVNHGTINININNIINNGDAEFSCDINLDSSIFRNKELTILSKQCLDGHKITMISKLVYTANKHFVYSRNNWYFFTNSIWKLDSDSIEMKKFIIDDIPKFFEKIRSFYEEEFKVAVEDRKEYLRKNIFNNIKSLIIKFHKPGFQDDIIKGAKIFYNDEKFVYNLNSKKHLVPFRNGVFDLLSNSFRKTKKDDYVNMTMNYEYQSNANNIEVYTFLEQVLPNPAVRDYVLKKMSECLNGDIPNTYFLMFIGDSGANGKSQLLNLMKLTMGDFGEKVEVTLLTRKRNNANEANTEKMKLMNKRFAFLSEPEDGEKINIGLLKELTGSEEIVARGLYQDAMSFVMEAKLFLACNELPEIKGEDTALWRRIRVIDFPSRFVDEPKDTNEYKIDRTLPTRMREDVTWRQTFMKILLSYYTRDVIEPDEVKMKTNEYRQENNDFYNWLEENIEYKEGGILKLSDTIELYLGKKLVSRQLGKYRKELEKYIKEKYKKDKYKNVEWEFKHITYNGNNFKGWVHLSLKDDISDV